MKLSEKILNLRKQHNMSQDDLAEKLNVSRQAVSRWENASALPDASNILQLSKLFGVTTDYLLYDEFEKDEDVPAVRTLNQKSSDAYRDRIRIIVGVCVSILSAISMLIIGILSSVFPCVYSVSSGEWSRVYTGLVGFLKSYNLEWLFILLIIMFFGGIITIFYPKIQPKVKIFWEKIQPFFIRRK